LFVVCQSAGVIHRSTRGVRVPCEGVADTSEIHVDVWTVVSICVGTVPPPRRCRPVFSCHRRWDRGSSSRRQQWKLLWQWSVIFTL